MPPLTSEEWHPARERSHSSRCRGWSVRFRSVAKPVVSPTPRAAAPSALSAQVEPLWRRHQAEDDRAANRERVALSGLDRNEFVEPCLIWCVDAVVAQDVILANHHAAVRARPKLHQR